jgi:hypothetical protein
MLDRDIVVPVSRRWGRTERGFIHEFRRPLLRPMVDPRPATRPSSHHI